MNKSDMHWLQSPLTELERKIGGLPLADDGNNEDLDTSNEETIARKIVISNCSQCPHKDHKGAFGRIAYVPVCKMKGKELPFDIHSSTHKNKPVATIRSGIPIWCPLEPN